MDRSSLQVFTVENVHTDRVIHSYDSLLEAYDCSTVDMIIMENK